MLKRFDLMFRSVKGYTRLPLLGIVYKSIAEAVELSTQARLKTPDLLHVAYAILFKRGESASKTSHCKPWLREDGETLRGVRVIQRLVAGPREITYLLKPC
jgi:hypothetical protein